MSQSVAQRGPLILSKDSKQPFRQMRSTMLHKLVHAYSFIRYGIYSNDGHDEHFRTMIHAIHRNSWHCYRLKVIDDWEPYKQDHFMSEYWTRGEHGQYGDYASRLESHSSPYDPNTDFTETEDSDSEEERGCRRHESRRHAHGGRNHNQGHDGRGHSSRYKERRRGHSGYGERDNDRYGGRSSRY